MMDIGEVAKNNTSVGGEGVHKAHPENNSTPSTDFVLQWGSRKRLRCMKIQVKNDSTTERTRVRVSRAVVRTTRDSSATATATTTTNNNFRRPFSPPHPLSHRNPRNSETSSAMRGQANGAVASSLSPERVAEEKKGENHNHAMNNGNGNVNGNGVGGGASAAASSDSKKGATSSGSDPAPVWLPKFVLTLTNKEKEEDFMAIKGSKLPQRPKKRAKLIQRSLNLVSPGSWLCDLTLERYEVREKKISKKRPRGLKAMGNMDSDSE